MRIVRRILLIIFMVLAWILAGIFGLITVLCYGPSEAVRDRFVNTVMETSALKFIPDIYFSKSQTAEILARGQVRVPTAVTDVTGIEIAANKKKAEPEAAEAESEEIPEEEPEDDAFAVEDGIRIEEIRTATYRGKMVIVEDPSRVSIHMIPGFAEGGVGQKVVDMAESTESIIGMNAGGFYDPEGHGKGGLPLGPVIREGQLVSNHPSNYRTIIGFDQEHRLIVGDMSADAAISAGVWEGIAFGPALVINGDRVPTGSSGGVNPRSAIGQRGDGAVLMLVIDGRQPASLGATVSDLEDVMLEYGAVNAANLDGGSSSVLYYKGELINSPSSVVGIRPVPDAILVK
ncbi:MAG: phosphodiester glycosidase family protein [Lachnospiraceae bacterium]|nr:phosphodiester glycosidase family protein [Lachnospiraceae bacterium]